MRRTALKTSKVPNPARKPPQPSCRPHSAASPGSLHWVRRIDPETGEVEFRAWVWFPADEHEAGTAEYGWWSITHDFIEPEEAFAQHGWTYAEPARAPGASPVRLVKP